jgi:hypothetical protein
MRVGTETDRREMQAKCQQANSNNKSRRAAFHLLGQELLPDGLATTCAFRLNVKVEAASCQRESRLSDRDITFSRANARDCRA